MDLDSGDYSKICVWCGEPFVTRYPWQRTCGPSCKTAWKREKSYKRASTLNGGCKICGKEITGQKKYCDACRQQRWRENGLRAHQKTQPVALYVAYYVAYTEQPWPQDELWPSNSMCPGISTTDSIYYPFWPNTIETQHADK